MRDAFEQAMRQLGRFQTAAYRDKRFSEVEARLNELLADAVSDEERAYVWAQLAGHHQLLASMNADSAANQRALHALQTCVQLCPDDALNWLSLAEHFHYIDGNLEDAARYADIALGKAMIEGNLVRQTLGARIRIALKRDDMKTVHASLETLVNQAPGKLDVALEDDFVSLIPSGGVPAELLARYQAKVASARSKAKRTS